MIRFAKILHLKHPNARPESGKTPWMLVIHTTQWYGHIGNSMMKSMRCLSDIEETHYFIRSADNSVLVIYLVPQYINKTN